MAQVLMPTQSLSFSQPHPVEIRVQIAKIDPHQLHCCPAATLEDKELATDDVEEAATEETIEEAALEELPPPMIEISSRIAVNKLFEAVAS